MRSAHIVIVGAGQAGGRAAQALRQLGYAGRLTLIGDEPEPPYERPALSKGILLGEERPESAYLHEPSYFQAAGIDLLLNTRVEAIEPSSKAVVLSSGAELSCSKLMLCTGSRVRTLGGVPGRIRGLYYLRTMRDCSSLASELRPGRKLVVIGGGFIGLEVASSALKRGLSVTVVERQPRLLDRVLPADIASYIEQLHRDKGVDIRLGTTIDRIQGAPVLERVHLSDGTSIATDLAVIGIGVIPNVELAESAGAKSSDGVVVDEFGKTSLNDVYAAGDVTNHPNPIIGTQLRLESWQNAQNQAIRVAQNLIGPPMPYAEVPWFWSDQLGINIQVVGVARRSDQIVWRRSAESTTCSAFVLESGRLTMAIAFNQGKEIRFARKLIEGRTQVDRNLLRDPSQSLKDLVGRR